jgi:hypothetical protein
VFKSNKIKANGKNKVPAVIVIPKIDKNALPGKLQAVIMTAANIGKINEFSVFTFPTEIRSIHQLVFEMRQKQEH